MVLPTNQGVGANAILGVSLAVAHAAADSLGISLYRYLGGTNAFTLQSRPMNVINGGKHAGNDLAYSGIHAPAKGCKDILRSNCAWVQRRIIFLGGLLVKKYGNSAVNVGYEADMLRRLKIRLMR